MLKPAVCTRDLCIFSFQTLRVASDAADDIATGAEVVDLVRTPRKEKKARPSMLKIVFFVFVVPQLVCFATIAAKSPRNNFIFDPFPTIFNPENPKEFILSPQHKGNKIFFILSLFFFFFSHLFLPDFNLVNQILGSFPSVEVMSQAKDFRDMKKKLDMAHVHAYALLQWIITSNRSFLVKLPQERSIASMATPHQYILASAAPEKERRFRELRAKYGSVFAFHGSPIENWHSILRTGYCEELQLFASFESLSLLL
jgi:poly [ADP-ribose] polymerase 6/8